MRAMKGARSEMHDADVEGAAVIGGQDHVRPGMAQRGRRQAFEGAGDTHKHNDVRALGHWQW